MMKGAMDSILGAIGRTPIVKLRRVGAEVPADIYVKCEYLNPAGSMKDRMVLHMIDQAERRGELRPGGTIIEATSGNTGAALAMVAAVRGYRCIFVMPDKMSEEKIRSLRAYGAKVVVCPTAVEPEDPRSYYSVARRLVAETPNAFYANQYHNQDNPDGHYRSTGPEIWEQTGGELDVVVAGMGTGGTLTGTGRYLRERRPDVKLVGVDPVGSLYYDLVKTGRMTKAFSYKVEGIGEDFVPSTIDLSLLDEVVRVDDGECFRTARDLVRYEGLYVGGSSGAAVAGAIKYAKQHGGKMNVLVILADSAAKYLSKIFDDDWMRENGFLEAAPGLGTVADVLRAKRGTGVITAQASEPVRRVVDRMKETGISQLPVLEGEELRGIVAEVDLLRCVVEGQHGIDTPVGAIIESEYASVTADTRIELLTGVLGESRMALVRDERGHLMGVVTKIDVIDYLAHRGATEPPPPP